MTAQRPAPVPKWSSDSSSGFSSRTIDSNGPHTPGPAISGLPLTTPRIWSSSPTPEEDSSGLPSTLGVAKLLFERSKSPIDFETLSDQPLLRDYFSTKASSPVAGKPLPRGKGSGTGLEIDDPNITDQDGSDGYTPTARVSGPTPKGSPLSSGKLKSDNVLVHPTVLRQAPKSVDFAFSVQEPKPLVQPPHIPPRPTAAVLQSNNLQSEPKNPALLSDKPAQPASLSELLRSLSVPMVSAVKLGENAVNGGAFADVWRGLMQPGDQQVALKILRLHLRGTDSQRLYKAIAREVSVWARLDHTNVLPFLGVRPQSDGSGLWLVSPWMEAGDVKTYLTSNPHADRVALTKGIASGVAYLHRSKIAHGDLKANNILVDDQGQPRLADFGLSLVLDDVLPEQTTSTMFAGSVRWMAPERINPSRFGLTAATCRTLASDVFSLAMTLYEVFTMRLPYHELNQMNVPSAIINGERPSHPGDDARQVGLSSAIWSFIRKCWEEIPQYRPVLAEIWETLDETLSSPSDTPRNTTPMPRQVTGSGTVLEYIPRATELATAKTWADAPLAAEATARPHLHLREGSQSPPISSAPTRRTNVPGTLVKEDRPLNSGANIIRPESAQHSWPFGNLVGDAAEMDDSRTRSLSDSMPLASQTTPVLNTIGRVTPPVPSHTVFSNVHPISNRPLPQADLLSANESPASFTSSMVSRNGKAQPSAIEDGTIRLHRGDSMPSFIASNMTDKPTNLPTPLEPRSAMVPGLPMKVSQKSSSEPGLQNVASTRSAAAGQYESAAQASGVPPASSPDHHAERGVIEPQRAPSSIGSRNPFRDLTPRGISGTGKEGTLQPAREVDTMKPEAPKSVPVEQPSSKVLESDSTGSGSRERPGPQAFEDIWFKLLTETSPTKFSAINVPMPVVPTADQTSPEQEALHSPTHHGPPADISQSSTKDPSELAIHLIDTGSNTPAHSKDGSPRLSGVSEDMLQLMDLPWTDLAGTLQSPEEAQPSAPEATDEQATAVLGQPPMTDTISEAAGSSEGGEVIIEDYDSHSDSDEHYDGDSEDGEVQPGHQANEPLIDIGEHMDALWLTVQKDIIDLGTLEPTDVFISNLDQSISLSKLKDLFKSFGPILSANITLDDQGSSKGFGYVSFVNHEDAVAALQKMDGATVGTKQLRLFTHEPAFS